MRHFALLTALTLLTPATADARLFWQTYGATVTTDGGCGCAWNINQDYFVPRHCDSGRYGLFSPCKTAHTVSPACKNLHPVYGGYCTPYGSCRYKWRDHVYKKYCGCTPLRHEYGTWHLEKCKKHCLVLRHGDHGCGMGPSCNSDNYLASQLPVEHFTREFHAPALMLCNVEPFGGEVLGSIAALAASPTGGGGAVAPTQASPAARSPALKFDLPQVPPSNGNLPAPFNY